MDRAWGGVVCSEDTAPVRGWAGESVVEVGVEFGRGLEVRVKRDLEAGGDLVTWDVDKGGQIWVEDKVACVESAVGGVVAVDEVGEAVDAAGERGGVSPHAGFRRGLLHLVGPFVCRLGGELGGGIADVEVAGFVVMRVIAAIEAV